MDRRAVLTSFAEMAMFTRVAAAAEVRPAFKAAPFLRISGAVGVTNNVISAGKAAGTRVFDFTEAAFMALPVATITTATSWTPSSVFQGPLVQTVMHAVGVTAGTLRFSSLNDYAISIPWADLVRYGVILAHSQNNRRLNKNRWGPLWVMYPRDSYPDALSGPVAESRFVWQVNKIEVSA